MPPEWHGTQKNGIPQKPYRHKGHPVEIALERRVISVLSRGHGTRFGNAQTMPKHRATGCLPKIFLARRLLGASSCHSPPQTPSTTIQNLERRPWYEPCRRLIGAVYCPLSRPRHPGGTPPNLATPPRENGIDLARDARDSGRGVWRDGCITVHQSDSLKARQTPEHSRPPSRDRRGLAGPSGREARGGLSRPVARRPPTPPLPPPTSRATTVPPRHRATPMSARPLHRPRGWHGSCIMQGSCHGWTLARARVGGGTVPQVARGWTMGGRAEARGQGGDPPEIQKRNRRGGPSFDEDALFF